MKLDSLGETARQAGKGVPLEVYARSVQHRGVMGIESSLLLSFVVGATASGLLTEIGKDTWSAIKKIAAKALGSWSAPSPMHVELVLSAGETTLVVSAQVTSDEDLRTLLTGARAVFDEYCKSGSVPSDPSIEVEMSSGPKRLSEIRSTGDRLTG